MFEFINDTESQVQTTLDAVVPRTEKWKENSQAWAEKPGLFVVMELKEIGEMIGHLSLSTGIPKNTSY